MTADSNTGSALAAHVGGHAEDGPTDLRAVPSEPFDIEPPYDATALDLEPDRFLDREVSWLHFNTRVLELAEDRSLPLLERVRFLAIFASNLDEFFMVRVAGLKRRIAAGVAVPAASGLLPREVLEQIWCTTSALMARQARLFREEIVPALAAEDIELLRWAGRLDPGFRGGGRQRAARAIEIALLSGRPLSWWQQEARARGVLDPWYIVLTVPRPVLHQRIARRAEEMMRRGLIEEVASVLAEGHAPQAPGLDGIGIREAVEYLHGGRTRESVAEAITLSTRQYAKRQQTWFRHQLGGSVITLDATRSPEKLAAEIAGLWKKTP